MSHDRNRIRVRLVRIEQGNLYEVMGEDQPLHCFPTFIVAEDLQGNVYYHNVPVSGHRPDEEGIPRPNMNWRAEAEQRADNVRSVGTIDPDLWTKAEPGETLEERLGEFGSEWQREQLERRGFPV